MKRSHIFLQIFLILKGTLYSTINASEYTISILNNDVDTKKVEQISLLMNEAYADYPYLYSGPIEEQIEYVEEALRNPNSIFIVLSVENEIVGVLFGFPLKGTNFATPSKVEVALTNVGYEVNNLFYLAEAVVKKEFRKKGLLSKMIQLFEKEVKNQEYKSICFVTIKMPSDHKLKPVGYIDIDLLAEHLGYQKTSLEFSLEWNSIVNEKNETKCMEHIHPIWIKELK